MKNKKLLITGGAGYIGSHAASMLLEKGYEVSVLDNLERGHKKAISGLKLFKVDLRDKDSVMAVFKKNKFDAVMHFAGLINVGESMQKPDLYFENNVSGTLNLLNAMSENGIKNLVFSSSAAVYGNPDKIPVKEDSGKKPTNSYGLTKLFVEQALPFYEKSYGMRSVSFRYFNACGASLDGNNGEAHHPEGHLIPLIIRAILKKKPSFSIFGGDYSTKDGTCVRDYIHVLDLVDAHLMGLEYLLKGGKSDNFNLGTARGYTNREVVEAVKRITNSKIKINITDRRPGDPDELIADNRKVTKILKWKHQYSDLDTIVRTSYDWHKKNPFTLKG